MSDHHDNDDIATRPGINPPDGASSTGVDRTGPLAWFAGHHVAANLLMIFVMVSGVMALGKLTVEIFPELALDSITVRVSYRGASPSEAESGVVLRVEEAVASIQGVKKLRSTASEGSGVVTIEIDDDAENQRVLDEVKSAVDRIDTFPDETEKPVVSEILTRRQVISVVVHGDLPQKTLAALGERVRDDLTGFDEISQADLRGLPPYEISIEISEDALRRYGLSFQQVAGAVRGSSLDLPGGSVKTDGGEILLRTEGQRYSGSEFEEVVVVSQADGTEIRLGSVATVRDDFADNAIVTRFDGQQAVMVQVYRTGDEGALEVTDRVRRYIAEARETLPPGVEITSWQDSSIVLGQRIGLLLGNARLGLVLVFISLALFLDLRLAFWTTMGIPISFLGGLWLLPYFGVTINMISLFAFIVSLGIVVDDAIIVGENVYSKLQEGLEPMDAAIQGVREMAVPVTFAVLTSVAAFLPMVFVEGSIGSVMRSIPLVVIAVLLMSLIESLLILPAHISAKKRSNDQQRGAIGRAVRPFFAGVEKIQSAFSRRLESFVDGPYRRFLERALEWKYLSASVAAVLLLLTLGLVGGGLVKFTFMPSVDADNMVAYLKMPQGTPTEQTTAIASRIEKLALEVGAEFDAEQGDGTPLIEHLATTVGEQPTAGAGGPTSTGSTSGNGSHLAEINVQLLASEDRSVASAELMNRWRQRVGEVPGAVALTYTASLFSAGDAVSVQLAHQDFDKLLAAADRLKAELSSYPGVFDIADSFVPGKEELKLDLTDEGRALGLNLADLARQVRQGFYGEEAQRIQRGRNDIRVMVRYPESERQSLGDVESMRIRLVDGTEVPFATVATVDRGRGYASINRVDRRRVVTVTAAVNESEANANQINDALRDQVLPVLSGEFPGLLAEFEGEQREQADSLGSLRSNFAIALLAIFALLAIPFRSYSQPLIVMAVIPFGFFGAVLGHLLMGENLTLLSLFGIVALTGVVVNDSLVMIDLINRERRAGVPVNQAIRDSGTRRFRPIMLTTVTTFLGLTPIIFETSLQARFLIPMAISLGFGIIFATAITLILVPVVYRILEDIHELFAERPAHPASRESHAADDFGDSLTGATPS